MKRLCDLEDRVVYRNVYNEKDYQKTLPLEPTPSKSITGTFDKRSESGDTKPVMLRGVTGSGKTEVFLQIIDYIISKGKQSDSSGSRNFVDPQMTERFVGRFGSLVRYFTAGFPW